MRTHVCGLAMAVLFCAAAAAQPLPLSSPGQEGLSKERLERLHSGFQAMTDEGRRAGAITMVVRNGRIADWQTYGYRDADARLPMEKDTICRIWSMTKVIASVAAMILVEEGRLALNDRADTFAPELKNIKVFQGGTAARPKLAPAVRPITIKHLLNHTAGFSYFFSPGPVGEIYKRTDVFKASSLKEFVGNAARVPLVAQPGEKYEYGINIDVLGYIVEAASGVPFDRFIQTRILDPLRMRDTHFVLPPEKKARLAKTYTTKDGKLVEMKESEFLTFDRNVPYGGMGLHSTIGDYARFAQMLLNGGELDGARILSRKTVELMTVNHLNHLAKPTIGGSDGEGFGLGGAVLIDLAKSGTLGSVGMFGWSGAATTYFRIDPKEKTVALLFMQYMPHDSATLQKFSTLFYQSIAD